MNNQKNIKKLAELLGIKTEYFDKSGQLKQTRAYECEKYLKILGYKTDNNEEIKNAIFETEFRQWSRFIDKTLVLKEAETPIIKLRIPTKRSKSKYIWILEKEDGATSEQVINIKDLYIESYKYFKNHGTYCQYILDLGIKLSLGYHNFKIFDELGNYSEMKIIVTPQKAYRPAIMKKKENLFGLSLDTKGLNQDNKFKISDNRDLKNVIKDIDAQKVDFVDIGMINQLNYSLKASSNQVIPASKNAFNALFLNIDDIIKFVGAKSIYAKNIENDLNHNNFKDIFNAKIKILKNIYQCFKDNHLNNKTVKAKEFYEFLEYKGTICKQQALFMAIEDFLKSENQKLTSWQDWPDEYKNLENKAVTNFKKNNSELIQFYEFVLWQEEQQLKQAGDLSMKNKLNVGICTTLPYFLNNTGAQSWCNQHLYAFNSKIKLDNAETENNILPPIPYKQEEDGYTNFINNLKTNFKYSGAVKIANIENYFSLLWHQDEDKDLTSFYVNYNFDNLLSIMALESQRNKTLIIVDSFDRLNPQIKHFVSKYDFLADTQLTNTTIKNAEELKKYCKQSTKKPAKSKNTISKIPNSTYRLQLSKDFTFAQAKSIIPYLKELGISHCYISPILKARSKSTHGYDIVNHDEFHTAIGTKQDFYDFADTLHSNGLGLICDIVPNHMGINSENIWWMDVLENGESSEYAHFFDIDWEPFKKELKSKILIPVLGNHYGNILNNGDLELKLNEENSKIELFYYDNKFPINPSSYPLIMMHRLNILASRLGANNQDFLEYQSIITAFKNLPDHTQSNLEFIETRKREKNISYNRMNILLKNNPQIKEFIKENLEDFKTGQESVLASQRLHNLLEEQVYRLAYWRVSVDEINYRRFFDVNDLAAIRIEAQDVFATTHHFIFELIKAGKVDGLRIDHPDGLLKPTKYFNQLQSEIAMLKDAEVNVDQHKCLSNENLPFYIVAEKILAPFEKLPHNWPIFGTVGYDFLNLINNLLIKKDNCEKLTKVYEDFIGKKVNFQNLVISCKKLIMKTSLTSELSMLTNHLNKISESNYSTRDFTFNNLRDALMQVTANFPVYRTYISTSNLDNKFTEYIKWAVGLAKKQTPYADNFIYEFIEQILLLNFEKNKESDLYKDMLEFSMKFQQYTAPLMAKGFEDTVFYRYNRLTSHNEVGSDLTRFGLSKSDFHNANIERFKNIPFNMSNTSTHDTKRSEDVRARINVLSEMPMLWKKHINKWHRLNKVRKVNNDGIFYPDKNDEYLFYQTLIGIMPNNDINNIDRQALSTRLEEYMLKAVREAKRHTSWLSINEQYENALKSFIQKIMNAPVKHPFWKDFLPFQKEIAEKGFINSTTQTILKLTLPGVPNIYQGCEAMNLTLVDPDNRRKVDFEELKALLNSNSYDKNQKSASKMFITKTLLKLRNELHFVFKYGNYESLEVKGRYKNNVIAYYRLFKKNFIIVILPLYPSEIDWESENSFENTRVTLTQDIEATDIFTNAKYKFNKEILINEVFNEKPFCVLKAKL